MQELEKILKEINYWINEYADHDYVRGSGDVVKGLSIAKSIIRKHLSRENTTEITRCSRDIQGAEHEINLPKEEFEMLRFSDSVSFRCGNEYVSLYMGEDEATREYKIVDDGWIPVEERLPEEYGEYLVTIVPSAGYLWAKIIIANFSDLMGIVKKPIFYTREVGKIDFEDITDMVIAWRPLPEPYRPERSET